VEEKFFRIDWTGLSMPCEISGGCEKSIDKNKGKAFVDEKHIGLAH